MPSSTLIDPAEASLRILKRRTKDKDPLVRRSAVIALASSLQEESVQLILKRIATRDKKASVRLAAVEALAPLASSDEPIRLMLDSKRRSDKDASVRARAASALGLVIG